MGKRCVQRKWTKRLQGPTRRNSGTEKRSPWLHLSHAHIILLQDTRWTPADDALWSSQWGLPVIWSAHNAILSTSFFFFFFFFFLLKIKKKTQVDLQGAVDKIYRDIIMRQLRDKIYR